MAGVLHEFVRECRAEHRRLCRVLTVWSNSEDLLETGVLPLTPAPDEPFELGRHILGLRSAMPGIETPFTELPADSADEGSGSEAADSRPSDAEDSPPADESAVAADSSRQAAAVPPAELARQRLNRSLARLGIDIVGVHGRLLELIADTVIDSQIHHALILAEDCFHICGVSVLGAIALANLAYACRYGDEDSGLVGFPLKAVRFYSDRFRNGDLLFWELAARSVHAAKENTNWGESERAVAEQHLPAFLAYSTVAKLDLAFDLPVEVLRAADYRTWPGLEALVSDEGAASIRRRVVGRLAVGCAGDPVIGTVIAGRWLDALAGLSDDLSATLLAARFLWELVGQNEGALAAMARHGKPSVSFLRAIERIEAWRYAPPPQDEPQSLAYGFLCDVAFCLDEFEVYRGLREVSRGAASVARPMATVAEE